MYFGGAPKMQVLYWEYTLTKRKIYQLILDTKQVSMHCMQSIGWFTLAKPLAQVNN